MSENEDEQVHGAMDDAGPPGAEGREAEEQARRDQHVWAGIAARTGDRPCRTPHADADRSTAHVILALWAST